MVTRSDITRNPTSQGLSPDDDSKLSDPEFVLANKVKEWHFHIYFHTNSPVQRTAALKLRDAVLALRRSGVFVAVPLGRVNVAPIGPHPAGSYEIWVPHESFAEVFSFMALNHGELSVLVHPLTRHEREDHSSRKAWIGQPWPILLDLLPEDLETVPLQYPALGFGYSSDAPELDREERERRARELEKKIKEEIGAE
ncbi:DOPA-like domain-containing protein [Pyronema domesticum]|uniref:Similar to DOPA 4,5-dioxygenase acc. no. P87064 n=1 Tax=Pyronema omphalodes (strain CBS 100304) TaxID=1076935 RepID=U4LK08_PYROM|nr:DOPA-like domain-containing protein [Pyronema domesticum]CCX13031.1 Similar to DOPA 4,5-dioxygenase; acc. no. P87064 [Pyronema omphalodes CBS 100304]